MRRQALLVFIALAVASGCATEPTSDRSGDQLEITGVVVAVEGDLTELSSFEMLTDNGARFSFRIDEGLLFGASEPISHLRDHMISGSPVVVHYRANGDELIATFAGDSH